MVIKLRSAVGVTMVWLAIVAGVSATAWFAIDRAGRDLTGGGVSPLSSLSAAATLGTAPRSSPTSTPGAAQPPAPSSARASAAAASPSATGSTSSPSAFTSALTGSASGAAGSTSPARGAAPRERSTSFAGGQVSVRCTGATILLRTAQPDNGWGVEVSSSGPREVRVEFKSSENDSAAETQLIAVCTNGAPAFTVENKN